MGKTEHDGRNDNSAVELTRGNYSFSAAPMPLCALRVPESGNRGKKEVSRFEFQVSSSSFKFGLPSFEFVFDH
jgi:hypothetical protein